MTHIRTISLPRSVMVLFRLIQIMPLQPYVQHLPNSSRSRFYAAVFPLLISRLILLLLFFCSPTKHEKMMMMMLLLMLLLIMMMMTTMAEMILFCFSYHTSLGLLVPHLRTMRNSSSLLICSILALPSYSLNKVLQKQAISISLQPCLAADSQLVLFQTPLCLMEREIPSLLSTVQAFLYPSPLLYGLCLLT